VPPRPETIESALDRARGAMRCCRLCELRCGVDRVVGETGPCGARATARVFRCYPSYAEELELVPALMVYLAGCNFRCRFCTQAPACYQADQGEELNGEETVRRIEAEAARLPWINLVGGEPSLHPAALLDLRARMHTAARWLLNTNGYFTPECFELIDSSIDLYVVDFKFGNDDCAHRLAGVPRYVDVLARNLRRIHASGPGRLLVRHLLIPGHERCCFEPVADWVAANLPAVRFHLMASYVPGPMVVRDELLGRSLPLEIASRALTHCRLRRLNLIE
jgi:putative pyruvate formate lyase activating enzyme